MSRQRTGWIWAAHNGYFSVKTFLMRRSLVLTTEAARHPFLASLPAHVRTREYENPAESLWRLTQDDVRGFASTYIAAFAAVLVFIV